MPLIQELKRRNVFRVGIAYAALAWVLAQVLALWLDTFVAPAWIMKTLLVLLLIGFPIALFMAWAFELTPEGLKREQDVDRNVPVTRRTARKLDLVVIAVLALALGYFIWNALAPDALEIGPTAPVTGEQGLVPKSEGPPLPTDKSIAVLPFVNRSSQQEDAYFTAGVHDDLLTQLAQISALRVISRTSVAQFEGTTRSIREIAQLLNVATVLEGGVQRAGNQVRINMQLIDASTDAHLWAHTFDRELTANNIFAIQSEIATAVAEALRATLSTEEHARIAAVPTENMQALEEYFQGRAEMDQRTGPSIESARHRFAQARKLDPGFALAWAGEAQAIVLLSDTDAYGSIPLAESNALARPLIERALELAPHDALVLAIFGLLLSAESNHADALEYFGRSLVLNPSNGEVLNWQRMSLFAVGRFRESFEVAVRMTEADPMSMVALSNGIRAVANTTYHDTEREAQQLHRLELISPSEAFRVRGELAEQRGELPEAARQYFLALQADPERSESRAGLADLLGRLHLDAEALNVNPQAAYALMIFNENWADWVLSAREQNKLNPDSLGAATSLLYALFWADQMDAAFEVSHEIWSRHGDRPQDIFDQAITMAEVARRTGHVDQSQLWRDASAQGLQAQIEAGDTQVGRYLWEFWLAAFDGRNDAAIAAMTRAIDKGFRWRFVFSYRAYEALHSDPRYQAQLSRLDELVTAERHEILEMLCGPNTTITAWTPAPETCALYEQELAMSQATTGNGK